MFYEAKGTSAEGYTVRVETGGREIVVDQKVELGGAGLGANPVQTVLAGIIGCRLMTARAYANKHRLNVTDLEATVSCETKDLKYDGKMNFAITMTVKGDLDEAQRQSLEKYVDKMCTVTKFLEVANTIETVTRYE
jgi:uncharacterized OsmC-like protein